LPIISDTHTDSPMKSLPVSTLVETLLFRANNTPDALAYAFDSERLTYAELHSEVTRVACALAASGLRPGDRCALLLPTSLDFVRAFHAVQAAGGIPLAINPEMP
jgi:acyl-CoA synthetase (AMP-forming)/AMP-acid ligase II